MVLASCSSPTKFRGVRSSKFKHVYGQGSKREQCFENLHITRDAHDGHFCAANPKFLAVVIEVGGGGSFVVVPIDKVGRADRHVPKVCGHSGPVLDIKWNPFNDNIIASASEDCTVKLWYIPDLGLAKDLKEHLIELIGHKRKVSLLEWHPTADNILVSAGLDHALIVWNISRGLPVKRIEGHTQTIYSMSFNRNGTLLATTSKDKRLRVIDTRTGEILREGECHKGTKASKTVYLGDSGKIFTTGFSKFSDRQYAVWSHHDLSKPLTIENIDSSSGILFPFYDHDTRMVYVAGKGDGNIRYFEVCDEPPHVYYLSQFISGEPQRSLGTMPKRGCITAKCEIFRFYKLHATKDIVEPLAMIVPRKSDYFQDDIYPETAAPMPALTAEEWLSGKNAPPRLMSLKAGKGIRTFRPVVYKPSERAVVASDRNNDLKFMFLSEETKPDFRPFDQRKESKPSPQIDHRPLGAPSYKNTKVNEETSSVSMKRPIDLSGSKFEDLQRKWISGTTKELTPSPTKDIIETSFKSGSFFPSGSTPVKNLMSKFNNGNKNEEEDVDGDLLVQELRQQVQNLRAEIDVRDIKIRHLEATISKMVPQIGENTNGSTIESNNK